MRTIFARLPALLALLGGLAASITALAHDPACAHHAHDLLAWAGPGAIGVVGIAATIWQAFTRPVAGPAAAKPSPAEG